ncbi:MAG: PEGA domain-containing protein [Deltaproteobacteria bacterium]|nr:PEGA domain-containing protein [Deltaproteobacteria bacterium]
MLAKRVIVVSAEKAYSRQLATALKAAGGTVDSHASLESLGKGELQAALVVMHLDGELSAAAAELVPRLTGDARVIAVLPRSNLPAVVDIMQSSERMAGILVAEELDLRELSAMATRVLNGDIFGLEKMVRWGAQVHSQLVGDYQEKALCISHVSEFAENMGVRRKYREAIEQCLDEMLMNALYDAPVDEAGKQIFSEIPTKTRISLRVEQKAVVQYACDGKTFAVSVRDAFGTLERGTVLKYLHKCLHSEQQIDRKAGGAGLGLYLMVNSATTVYFNVLPGVATEALCVFDLEAPKLQIEHFGFFTEKIDAAGRLAAGQSRLLPGTAHPVERRRSQQSIEAPPPPRSIIAVLTLAIIAVLALALVAAWPRLFPSKKLTDVTIATVPKGATVEVEGKNAGTATDGTLVVHGLEVGRAYPIVVKADGYEAKTDVVQPTGKNDRVGFDLKALAAAVEIDSQPTGASIEIDGKPAGTTPLTLMTLAPSSSVSITFKKSGYHDATSQLAVPGPGKTMRFVQPLAVSDELARVKVVSDPPGAQVSLNGQMLAGVTTPAEVLVEAGKPARFTLTLANHVPLTLDPFTPARGAEGIQKGGTLKEGQTLHIDTNLDNAKVTVSGAPHCKDLVPPADCMLSPGSYIIDLTGPQGAHAQRNVTMAAKAKTEKLEFGYVEAGQGKKLVTPGGQVAKLAIEVGAHTVTVADENGNHPANVRVKPGATVIAN